MKRNKINNKKNKVTIKKRTVKNTVMKNKLNILLSAVTIIIVAAVVLSFVYSNPDPGKVASNPDPGKSNKVLEISTYEKVSNSDLLSNGANHIYFITWYGCPVGADSSWVFYSLLNSTTNGSASKDVVLHSSLPNTPGLLFLKGIPSDFPLRGNPYGNFMENISFSYNNVPFTFTSLYMYNETLSGTPFHQGFGNPGTNGYNTTRINYGLNIIEDNLPASVYNVAKEYETVIPVADQTQSLGDIDGHLATMFILTGPDGTYFYTGYMYPSFSPNVSPELVFHAYKTYTPIVNAESTLINFLEDIDGA